MTTSDGISKEDWDTIHELTIEVVNAATEEGRDACRRRLLEQLNQLELRYGPLPSIFATRADFIGDLNEKTELLHRAYELARARGDRRNMLYVAHSLAFVYIEDRRDATTGKKWLFYLRQGLVEIDDSWFAEEHERLLSVADDLDRSLG